MNAVEQSTEKKREKKGRKKEKKGHSLAKKRWINRKQNKHVFFKEFSKTEVNHNIHKTNKEL